MSYEVYDGDEETNEGYKMSQINKDILIILFL